MACRFARGTILGPSSSKRDEGIKFGLKCSNPLQVKSIVLCFGDIARTYNNPYLSPERRNSGIEDTIKCLFQIWRHNNKTFDSLLQVDKRRFDDS